MHIIVDVPVSIKLHIEIKVNGKWEHYGAPLIRKDISVFRKLAGLCEEDLPNITPISKPKGLPDNLNIITQSHYLYGSDFNYAESWIGIEEIKEFSNWLSEYKDCNIHIDFLHSFLFENSFFQPEESAPILNVEDVRFVFWFKKKTSRIEIKA